MVKGLKYYFVLCVQKRGEDHSHLDSKQMFLSYRTQENCGGIIYTQILENTIFNLPKY